METYQDALILLLLSRATMQFPTPTAIPLEEVEPSKVQIGHSSSREFFVDLAKLQGDDTKASVPFG